MFEYLRNYEVKNVKTINGPAKSTNLIFQKLKKCNQISGETVPLSDMKKNIQISFTCLFIDFNLSERLSSLTVEKSNFSGIGHTHSAKKTTESSTTRRKLVPMI